MSQPTPHTPQLPQTAADRPTILLVDDDRVFRERLGRALRCPETPGEADVARCAVMVVAPAGAFACNKRMK